MTAINLSVFQFNKSNKSLYAASEVFAGQFPRTIDIKSGHTGRVVRFTQNTLKAEQNEFWDGEMMEYIPTVPLNNVERLIVRHEW